MDPLILGTVLVASAAAIAAFSVALIVVCVVGFWQ
ncbi:MAG: hypothetical protein KatS3mg053_2749 [Candidatus Roseilinea sp.]|nr:MAG: hypothetical protein KatS3mg053_2749 [Candidatus Roseilinea sp.]